MLIYRITLARYADKLISSGNEGRWNSRGAKVIYSAGSRSLACLENIVHRNGIGSDQSYRAMIIEVPDSIPVKEILLKHLPEGWANLFSAKLTRSMGDEWYTRNETPVLKVPSAIVPAENNYILNTLHPLFKRVKLLQTEPFLFDPRL